MTYLHSFILGIVEGITEFLPVSSTGHLILVSKMLGLPDTDFIKSFEIIIQLGAILAVVMLYFSRIIRNLDLIKKIIIAFIPTALLGLVFYKIIKTYLLGNPLIVVLSLVIGGIIILGFEAYLKNKTFASKEISYTQAFWIGVIQSLAMIPGVSRSGATILGGLGMGINREMIVEFSFMLAIPIMFAASLLDILKSYDTILVGGNLNLLAIGFLTSFVTAWFAIKYFLRYIKNHDFKIFGYYRIVIGVLFYLFFL